MPEAADATVSHLLDEFQAGDREALNGLFPLVYDELRRLARQHRRHWFGDETLDTTALVHEAYVKLVGQQQLAATSRAHFLAIAAKAMRQILGDYARARRRLKRGGGARKLSLDALEGLPDATIFSIVQADDAPDFDDALTVLDEVLVLLEREDVRLSLVVECRFFGGLSIADTASVAGTSPATVKRDWTLARAWLLREMQLRGTLAASDDG